MKPRFRLTRSTDFKRVRRFGKSYAHSMVVMYVVTSGHPHPRIGVGAGRTVGNAVQRNRAKRMLREAVRPILDQIVPGADIILVARAALLTSSLAQIQGAIKELLRRAGFLNVFHDD